MKHPVLYTGTEVSVKTINVHQATYLSCAVCGSDLHSYFSILPVAPTTLVPHVVTGETLPIGMGHE